MSANIYKIHVKTVQNHYKLMSKFRKLKIKSEILTLWIETFVFVIIGRNHESEGLVKILWVIQVALYIRMSLDICNQLSIQRCLVCMLFLVVKYKCRNQNGNTLTSKLCKEIKLNAHWLIKVQCRIISQWDMPMLK